MPTNYERGRATEYRVIEQLEKVGYSASRTAGSHGKFDVIAWNPISIRLIQCKRTKDGQAKYDIDLEQIRAERVPHNCTRELWVWQDGKGWILQEVI